MTCSVELVLDQDLKSHTFTGLEQISGKVIVKVNREISVENIQIKLEGTSFTKITKRVRSRASTKSRLITKQEEHNLLYDCDTLFPPDNIKSVTKNRDGFTLTPGKYDYNFNFKFPFNCYCGDPNSVKLFSNIYNSPAENYAVTSPKAQKIQQQRQNNNGFNQNTNHNSAIQHTVCPLPPSTSSNGFENFFKIFYFLKVTVRRASMFKSNIRQIYPLSFTTFEPDSLTIKRYLETVPELNNRSKTYVLNKEAVINNLNIDEKTSSKSSFFGKMSSSLSSSHKTTIQKNVSFQVDIKFTDKIIRPGQPPFIQMSLVTELNPSEFLTPETNKSNTLGEIFISNFVITLIRQVTYRAEVFVDTLTRTVDLKNIGNSIILDLSNAIRNEEGLYELEFPSSIFQKMILPEFDLPPSFQSCNITNTYSLRIKAHISSKSNSFRSEKLDFSTSVWVLSGAHIPFVTQDEFPTAVPPPGPPPNIQNDILPNFNQLNVNDEELGSNDSLSNPATQSNGNTPSADSLPIAHDNNNNDVSEELPSYNEAVQSSLSSFR